MDDDVEIELESFFFFFGSFFPMICFSQNKIKSFGIVLSAACGWISFSTILSAWDNTFCHFKFFFYD